MAAQQALVVLLSIVILAAVSSAAEQPTHDEAVAALQRLKVEVYAPNPDFASVNLLWQRLPDRVSLLDVPALRERINERLEEQRCADRLERERRRDEIRRRLGR